MKFEAYYESVPLSDVIEATNTFQPLFTDFETLGLYGDIVLAQFKQEDWTEALLVEYPNENELRDFLASQHVICYNIAYDMGTLGLAPERMDDLFFSAKTAFPLQESHSLSETAPHFYEGIVKKDMQKSFMKKRESFTKEQLQYGALDVWALEWIWNRDDIQTVMAENLAYKVDIKAQQLALDYQHNGMPVIAKEYYKTVILTERERKTHQKELNDILGIELNVKSWMQKQKAFPELPWNEKGKQPTDAKAFKKLMLESDNIEKARKYELVLLTTKNRTDLSDLEKYSESYIPDEDPVRIRTFFNVAGAITGRFTSKGGDRVGYTNIQNISRGFKGIFGYEDDSDRSLVSADYSTAELIAGCSIFKVPTMKELIMEGIDLHKAMASEVTGKPVEDITKEERQSAKAVNFGYLFGMGTEKFQNYAYDTFGVKLTLDEAKEYKAIYYTAHPAIAKAHKTMAKDIKKSEFVVETALGRKVKPDRYADALNIPVQGTIGETTKLSQIYLFEDYAKLMKEVKFVNTVHDSNVIDCPDEYIDDVAEALEKSMKQAWVEISKSPLFHYHSLPMGVDIEYGKKWS